MKAPTEASDFWLGIIGGALITLLLMLAYTFSNKCVKKRDLRRQLVETHAEPDLEEPINSNAVINN